MSRKYLVANALTLSLLLFILCPVPAQAYFDLGSGTMMIPILLGFSAAIWFSFRSSLSRLFRKVPNSQDRGQESSSKADSINSES